MNERVFERMNAKDIEPFLNRRIKIRLKTGYFYNGNIINTSDDSLRFKDKFGVELLIAYDNIALIEVTNEELE